MEDLPPAFGGGCSVHHMVSGMCWQVLVADKAGSESDPRGWMSQVFQETTEAAGQLAALNQNFADQVHWSLHCRGLSIQYS